MAPTWSSAPYPPWVRSWRPADAPPAWPVPFGSGIHEPADMEVRMGEAIGQLLPFAAGVAISPMPIVAMVLMLITPRAKSNGFAFIMGWLFGVAVAGAIALAILGPTT